MPTFSFDTSGSSVTSVLRKQKFEWNSFSRIFKRALFSTVLHDVHNIQQIRFFFCLVEKSLLTVIDSSMNTKNSRENTADIKFQSKVECYQNGYRLSKEVRNWRKTKRWHSQSSIHNWENSICEKLLQIHSCTGQDRRICVRRSSMVSTI